MKNGKKYAAEQERNRRNLNPHRPALLAMFKWGEEYAAQRGGSMDFWDSLSESRKRICREFVERLEKAGPSGEQVGP